MFDALGKAIRQSGDPAFRSVFLKALLLSILLFALSWAAAWWGLSWGGEALAAWTAEMGIEGFWQDLVLWLVQALGLAGILVASFFLFPAITGLLISFLLDDWLHAEYTRPLYDDGRVVLLGRGGVEASPR